MARFGIDFGTTNSVVAKAGGQTISLGTDDVFRSILAFLGSAGRHVAGPAAAEAYLDDPEACRLMMSLKSHLGEPSLRDTLVFGRSMALESLIATFLRHLLAAAGVPPGAAVTAGRPVRFVGGRADDALAESRLRAAFAQAGISDLVLALEPEAAGARFAAGLTRPASVLVGDFGGGTSDFSVLRFTPGARAVALGHAGIGVAGDDFDAAILRHAVAPLLGQGGEYTPFEQPMPIPAAYFDGFQRWHRLAQMRMPKMLREIADVARRSNVPRELDMLRMLIEDEQGLALNAAVVAAKRALSTAPEARFTFHHRDIHIERHITRAEFETWIARDIARIATTVDAALADAGCTEADIDHVFLTGGSALVPAVRAVFEARFGAARLAGGGEFLAIAEGLALL
ncbi:MAG: Hsp70 family protein [Alphaproteobacteria bacterium]|nr:Hsp70 family protein [Alphaproteobacteria bacterium]